MENTGRIKKAIGPIAYRVLYGEAFGPQFEEELRHISTVDRAHVVMLAECGLVERVLAARLLGAIERLRATGFHALRNCRTPRGIFLLYEDYLIETEGAAAGGILQTARSRNDLNATTLKMRLRRPYAGLLRQGLRLQAVLLRRAKRYAGVVMPAYTHGQAATPITYGHYLAGVATALSRDLRGFADSGSGLSRCPLGAGSGGGASLPIDAERTAQLLGFETTPLHSVDAVASRDTVLRHLAAAAILGVTLSRLATDLLQWSAPEFDLLRLPDELVGSSSAMPQKRNPFLLEHVQGRSASALGAFVAAASAMRSSPFANSISVGTEGVSAVWKALQDTADVTVLARLMVAGAQPNPKAMVGRATLAFTNATALANRLVAVAGLDFRTAHRVVGETVRYGEEHHLECLEQAASACLPASGIDVSLEGLDPVSVAMACDRGGGPAPQSIGRCLTHERSEWSRLAREKNRLERQWRSAESALDEAVRRLCAAASALKYGSRDPINNAETSIPRQVTQE